MKNTELIKAEDFGIEKKQEKELLADLPQIQKERDVLIKQYDEVIKLDVESPDSWKKARELRLLIQKNRTQGINVWHKNAKDYFLKGGQFVDAIKRKECAVNERMEGSLLEIEKYEEILRKKEIERLNNLRVSEIETYKEYVTFGVNLGELNEDEYKKLYNGAKLQHEAEVERLRNEEIERAKAEQIENLNRERKDLLVEVWNFVKDKNQKFGEMSEDDFNSMFSELKAEKSKAEKEQERIRKENERLKKEEEIREKIRSKRAKELQPYLVFVKDYSSLINLDEEDYKAQFSEIKKGAELQWEYEREQEREAELKAKKELEEKLALQAKIKAIEKEKEAEKAEAEKLRKAPIKEQMTVWISSLDIPSIDIENDVKDDIIVKFESFKKWALNKIKEM